MNTVKLFLIPLAKINLKERNSLKLMKDMES